jgi:hypothetical protein
MNTASPYSIAAHKGLDPHGNTQGRKGHEARMRCPEGCDDQRRQRHDYSASLVLDGEDGGLWCCYKCGASGKLREDDGERVPHREPPPKKPTPPPIHFAEAFAELRRLDMTAPIRAWATSRGWPPALADVLASSPDVAWAPDAPCGLSPDAERLRASAYLPVGSRPLLVAVRNKEGVPCAAMRRYSGQGGVGSLPKSLSTPSVMTPTPEGERFFGHPAAAIEAAKHHRHNLPILVAEGEPDYLLAWAIWAEAQADKSLTPPPWAAVLGCPAWAGLRGLGEELVKLLEAQPEARSDGAPLRFVLVPHIGDKAEIGAAKMAHFGEQLAKAGALVSSVVLPRLKGGKVDIGDYVAAHGPEAFADQVREHLPLRIAFQGGWVNFGDEVVLVRRVSAKEQAEGGGDAGGEAQERWRRSRIARAIYPAALARGNDGGGQGVKVVYHDSSLGVGRVVVGGGCWADKAPATKEAARLGGQGVQIEPRKGADVVFALGAYASWASRRFDVPRLTYVRTQGWHGQPREGRGIYVHGDKIFGPDAASWVYHLGDGTTHALRGTRAGSTASWVEGATALAKTPTLRAFLALAFAGPLLGPLGLPSFLLNIWGDSGSGKTTATLLAASLWGRPGAWGQKWSATGNALESGLARRTDAFAVLDELKLMPPDALGPMIHRIADGLGRARLGVTSEAVPDLRWSLTVASTGENAVRQTLGRLYQGGHAVRAIDVAVRRDQPRDKAAIDAAHAHAIEAFAADNHGHAGEAWVRHLAHFGADDWARLKAAHAELYGALHHNCDGDAEAGRILRSLSILPVAAAEARRAGLWTLADAEATAIVTHLLRSVLAERKTERTPNERCWAALRAAFSSRPAHFPTEDAFRARTSAAPVWGVAKTRSEAVPFSFAVIEKTGELYTTPTLLAEWGGCKEAGVDPSAFLRWLGDKGHAKAPEKTSKVGGHAQRWWLLAVEAEEGDPDQGNLLAPRPADP